MTAAPLPSLSVQQITEQLEELLAKATPRPWNAATAPHPGSGQTHAQYLVQSLRPEHGRPLWVAWSADKGKDDEADPIEYTVPFVTGDGPTSEINAELIVALVNAAPELLATLRRLQAACDAKQAVIDAVTELADQAQARQDRSFSVMFDGTKFPVNVPLTDLRSALASPDIAQDAGAS